MTEFAMNKTIYLANKKFIQVRKNNTLSLGGVFYHTMNSIYYSLKHYIGYRTPLHKRLISQGASKFITNSGLDMPVYGTREELNNGFSVWSYIYTSAWLLAGYIRLRNRSVETKIRGAKMFELQYEETKNLLISKELTAQLIAIGTPLNSTLDTTAAIIARISSRMPRINLNRIDYKAIENSRLYSMHCHADQAFLGAESQLFLEPPQLTEDSTNLDITLRKSLEGQFTRLNRVPSLGLLALQTLMSALR